MAIWPFNLIASFKRNQAPAANMTVVPLISPVSEWKSFANKHQPGLARITVANIGLNNMLPDQEKIERLNYMYEELHQITNKRNIVEAAEIILIATKCLDIDKDIRSCSTAFYAIEACESIHRCAPQIFNECPGQAVKAVETGITILTAISERNRQQGIMHSVPDRLLKEFTELHSKLVQKIVPGTTIIEFVPK